MKRFSIQNKNIKTLATILLITIWWLGSLVYNNPDLIPSPLTIFRSLGDIVMSNNFFTIIGSSIIRGLLGLLISLILGTVLGMLSGLYKEIEDSLSPILTVIKSTPIMAIILLLLIWFGTEKAPVFATIMVAFPILYANVLAGTRNVDPKLINMAKLYKVRPIKIIREIYLPSTFPFIFAGMEAAFSIGWKVTVGAEVLSQPKYAIGSQMWDAKIYLDINYLFAWTIIAIIISAIIELFIRLIKKNVVKWEVNNES